MPQNSATGFDILDHPADMGLRAWAPAVPALFAECALALTAVLVDLDTIAAKETMTVEVSGDDLETLLYNWLSEILYLYDGEGKLFNQFDIVNQERRDGLERLTARLSGQPVSGSTHQLKTYVKAITYHQLAIEKSERGYTAQVYLDI